jgi:hypothetical protein
MPSLVYWSMTTTLSVPCEVAAGQAAGVGIAGGEVGVGAVGAVLIAGGADR